MNVLRLLASGGGQGRAEGVLSRSTVPSCWDRDGLCPELHSSFPVLLSCLSSQGRCRGLCPHHMSQVPCGAGTDADGTRGIPIFKVRGNVREREVWERERLVAARCLWIKEASHRPRASPRGNNVWLAKKRCNGNK